MNYTQTIKPFKESPVDYAFEEWDDQVNKDRRQADRDALWKFKNDIESLQTGSYSNRINILFNKGRYIEFTPPGNDLRRFIAQSAKVKVEFGSMIVCGTHKIEAVVKALNKKGYHVKLNLDWI